MPIVKLSDVPETSGTGYPPPFDTPCLSRRKKAVGDFGGLDQFGAHVITLPPGSWSSQRHWHSHEDELGYIISGTPLFVDDAGVTRLSPGDFTVHPAGDGSGHHMKNDTDAEVVFLIVGSRRPEEDSGHYPDIDLAIPANGTPNRVFTRKDGTPY